MTIHQQNITAHNVTRSREVKANDRFLEDADGDQETFAKTKIAQRASQSGPEVSAMFDSLR